MREPTPDEKIVTVMTYTSNMLARGDMIVKENMRVSILLRTEGAPNYIHLYKPQVVSFAGGAPKSFSYSEMFIPVPQVVAFHIAPPVQDVLDYDPNEANRMMAPLDVMVASFRIKCGMRISTMTDVSTSLDVMRAVWTSVYEADISNSVMPQFNVHVPMLLVNSNYVNFGVA